MVVSFLRSDRLVHTLKLKRANIDAKALRKLGHLLEYNGCMHYNGLPISFKVSSLSAFDGAGSMGLAMRDDSCRDNKLSKSPNKASISSTILAWAMEPSRVSTFGSTRN